MTNIYSTYKLFDIPHPNGLRFSFISNGTNDIIKVVDYSVVGVKSDIIKTSYIFNFGFGDFDIETQMLKDDVMSDNGDVRKVFYTSLSTIPLFFQRFPSEAIMVTGSDSKDDFHDKCFPKCRKKCSEPVYCKNKHQRINVYTMYLDKHFEELNIDYTFFGGIDEIIEPYEPQKKYKAVFVIKK
jgi:hypothetical protein